MSTPLARRRTPAGRLAPSGPTIGALNANVSPTPPSVTATASRTTPTELAVVPVIDAVSTSANVIDEFSRPFSGIDWLGTTPNVPAAVELASRKNPLSPITASAARSYRWSIEPLAVPASLSTPITLNPARLVPGVPNSSTYSGSVPVVEISAALISTGSPVAAPAWPGTGTVTSPKTAAEASAARANRCIEGPLRDSARVGCPANVPSPDGAHTSNR